MNKIALSAVALLAAGPALAGGFAPVVVAPAPTAPVVVPVAPVATSNWSGGYVGGQLGYGRLAVDDGDDEFDSLVEEDTYDGALYGLHAGYRFDFGSIVAGAELDFDGANIEIPAEDLDSEEPLEVGSIRRLKAQLGFDAGRVLPYVTAGLAQAVIQSDDEGLDEDLGGTYDGRFIGVGASYMLSDNFMVGVEALRHSFDDLEESAVPDGEFEVNTISLRGSFRF